MTPEYLIMRAGRVGYHVAVLVERLMRERPHPEQGYRSSLGILSLERRFGRERLEAACDRALTHNTVSYASVKSILVTGLDKAAKEPAPILPPRVTTTSVAPRTTNNSRKDKTMLTHPTLEQMASLGLNGIATAWHTLAEQDPGEALDRNEWLGMMLDREVAHRADKRFANRLRNAKMRFPNACIEDISFTATRGLDRRQILSRGQGGWLKAHEQIILAGQTGTGKSWLACAFAHQAARMDHPVAYARIPRLFEDLATALLDGRFPKLIDKLARVQLLVLDDWGTHSLTDQQRLDLLELFEERYQRKSTIITAQLPVSGWHQMIGEPTIADAILDRIIHNARRIELKGDSMRRKNDNPALTPSENTEIISQDQ